MAKLKLKTKRAAAKRFRITKSGNIKRKKAYLRHNLSKRQKSTKMVLRQMGYVSPSDAPSVKDMLPN